MKTIPILNDSNNPMVSVLIYDYDGLYLKQCLDSILNQEILTNLEIILIDDATDDGSWDTAVEYSLNYPGVITISRNKRFLGPIYIRRAMLDGRDMANEVCAKCNFIKYRSFAEDDLQEVAERLKGVYQ